MNSSLDNLGKGEIISSMYLLSYSIPGFNFDSYLYLVLTLEEINVGNGPIYFKDEVLGHDNNFGCVNKWSIGFQ